MLGATNKSALRTQTEFMCWGDAVAMDARVSSALCDTCLWSHLGQIRTQPVVLTTIEHQVYLISYSLLATASLVWFGLQLLLFAGEHVMWLQVSLDSPAVACEWY